MNDYYLLCNFYTYFVKCSCIELSLIKNYYYYYYYLNVSKYRRGLSKMDNPKKLEKIGYTRRRQTKLKHNTACVGQY